MKNTELQALQHLLSPSSSSLGKLVEKVTELQSINQHLQNILSPPLQNNCWVANLRADCLVIATSSANWLTYLRFEKTNLLTKLQHQYSLTHITDLHFIVSPNPVVNNPSENSFRPALSATSANIIISTANGIKDEVLRQALLKLAKNTN